MQDNLDDHTRQCLERCLACSEACLSTAMGQCLTVGGARVENEHFTLMIACTEICRISAHFLRIGAPIPALCAECAEICESCAADCERLGGMEACVAACRICAESCLALAA